MIRLYQWEPCPYCKMVRQKLEDLKVPYTIVEVPRERSARNAVFEASGQWTVPVLEDDGQVIVDEEAIIPFLEKKYG